MGETTRSTTPYKLPQLDDVRHELNTTSRDDPNYGHRTGTNMISAERRALAYERGYSLQEPS